MTDKKPGYDEFIALARRGLNDGDLTAAPGFAARVAARWTGSPPGGGWLAVWERALYWGSASTFAVCLLLAWFCRGDFSPTARAADSLAAFAGLDESDDDTPL